MAAERSERVADWRDALHGRTIGSQSFSWQETYAPPRVAVIVALLPARTAVNPG
jgi:hypothetical protein